MPIEWNSAHVQLLQLNAHTCVSYCVLCDDKIITENFIFFLCKLNIVVFVINNLIVLFLWCREGNWMQFTTTCAAWCPLIQCNLQGKVSFLCSTRTGKRWVQSLLGNFVAHRYFSKRSHHDDIIINIMPLFYLLNAAVPSDMCTYDLFPCTL